MNGARANLVSARVGASVMIALSTLAALAGCSGTSTHLESPTTSAAAPSVDASADAGRPTAQTADGPIAGSSSGTVVRESPPPTGPRQDIHFPTIARSSLPNGLEVNVIETHTLPLVHLRLVARAAGSVADPNETPGLAAFVGDMLKEGTRTRTSAQIAEAIEFVGGTLTIGTSPDATVISVGVLRDHLDEALALLADILTNPIFPQAEIDKLRRREIERLTQSQQDPTWLSRRAFYQGVYGSHPYARVDSTPASLARITRGDLVAFHRARYVGGSMFLAVVGDVRGAEFSPLATRTLGRIRRATAPALRFPAVPASTARRVIIVDRANSAQTMIRIGNASIRRASDEYVPLAVANQVLGGDASSRLFMDLRERRSLTYGAYSRVFAGVDIGTFQASGSVRTPVTAEALTAFIEHLNRITRDAAPPEEIEQARSYLIDSFPLSIATAGDVANLLVELRLYGLPDTYWDTYRTRIAGVAPAQALEAAQRYIHPDRATIVLVGSAETFENEARRLGPVRVVNVSGETLRELPAL